jgi:hypothetical protein
MSATDKMPVIALGLKNGNEVVSMFDDKLYGIYFYVFL